MCAIPMKIVMRSSVVSWLVTFRTGLYGSAKPKYSLKRTPKMMEVMEQGIRIFPTVPYVRLDIMLLAKDLIFFGSRRALDLPPAILTSQKETRSITAPSPTSPSINPKKMGKTIAKVGVGSTSELLGREKKRTRNSKYLIEGLFWSSVGASSSFASTLSIV